MKQNIAIEIIFEKMVLDVTLTTLAFWQLLMCRPSIATPLSSAYTISTWCLPAIALIVSVVTDKHGTRKGSPKQ